MLHLYSDQQPPCISVISRPKILIADDELLIRRLLQRVLEQAGYAITTAANAEEALALLELEQFDLLLTDLKLGAIDGITLISRAHERDPALAVILFTGYASLESAIAAVQHGAYNYIIKPGRAHEIEDSVAGALAHRQLRSGIPLTHRSATAPAPRHIAEPRGGPQGVSYQLPAPPSQLQIGDLLIDIERHLVICGSKQLQLSCGEFSLLVYCARRVEQIVTPLQIVHELLGYSCELDEARAIVKVRVHALRKHIEEQPSQPVRLINVRGVGYKLTAKGVGDSKPRPEQPLLP